MNFLVVAFIALLFAARIGEPLTFRWIVALTIFTAKAMLLIFTRRATLEWEAGNFNERQT